jgi:phosphatidate cytidylyltransferase
MSGDLRLRLGVAVVGIPAALGLAYLGGWYLAVPLAVMAAWGTHEVYRFAEKKGVRPIEPVGVLLSAAFVLLAAWRPTFSEYAPWALGTLAVGALMSVLGAMRSRAPNEHPLSVASVTLFGSVYVGLALAFVPLLHGLDDGAGVVPPGSGWVVVVLPLVATWAGDASAYFAGSAWGKGRARLAPTISPNKSWVGFWAALAGSAVAVWLWSLVARSDAVGLDLAGPSPLLATGAALGLAAVLGDLTESLLKREAGVKDSGTFFPGHGGVLDRIDSLIFTFPTAYVALTVAGVLR